MKITRLHHQIIVIVLAMVFVASCTPDPIPIPPSTELTPTTVVTESVPTSPPATLEPTTTALLAISTDAQPTTGPSTEEIETDPNQESLNEMETNRMNIQIGDTVLTATLVDNSSVDALKEALAGGPITIMMRDYGNMEKVGSLGMDLPRNDEQITTQAGDIILYQGNALVIYYAPNSWNFTRLGKIDGVSAEELREILGHSNVTITLSLP